jgi:predicted dehydrogenase
MKSDSQSSRRDFLAQSAKMAAAAGLIGSAGCAHSKGPKLAVRQGPQPPVIHPGQRLRLGLIGAGGRGNNLLDQAITHEDVDIVAIADPDDSNVKKTLNKLREKNLALPQLYWGADDYQRVMARDDIDALLIAVPCDLHAKMYLDCFACGKHFYGEKPMCIAVNEVEAIVEAQKKNPDVLCQIGFQRRASSFYQEGIKHIHEGMIGVPFEARGTWRISGGPLGMPSDGTRVWFGRRERSGDWMLEQACHTWDVLCWVAGAMPVAASGRGRSDLFKKEDPERDVTDFYVAHLEFPNGMIADFEHNWRCPHKDEHYNFTGVYERFVGLDGGIDLALWPAACHYYPRDPANQARELAPTKPNATAQSVDAFLNSLRTNTRPVSTVENGRLATLTGLLVRKAVYENRRVEMKELLA